MVDEAHCNVDWYLYVIICYTIQVYIFNKFIIYMCYFNNNLLQVFEKRMMVVDFVSWSLTILTSMQTLWPDKIQLMGIGQTSIIG